MRRTSQAEAELIAREIAVMPIELMPVETDLELVRLALPRRVYTNEHMRYVAESVIAIHRERERLKGLRITWEAPALRHFTARLEELARP